MTSLELFALLLLKSICNGTSPATEKAVNNYSCIALAATTLINLARVGIEKYYQHRHKVSITNINVEAAPGPHPTNKCRSCCRNIFSFFHHPKMANVSSGSSSSTQSISQYQGATNYGSIS
jgi:hypothetical protein